jgi:hypothetical protein
MKFDKDMLANTINRPKVLGASSIAIPPITILSLNQVRLDVPQEALSGTKLETSHTPMHMAKKRREQELNLKRSDFQGIKPYCTLHSIYYVYQKCPKERLEIFRQRFKTWSKGVGHFG